MTLLRVPAPLRPRLRRVRGPDAAAPLQQPLQTPTEVVPSAGRGEAGGRLHLVQQRHSDTGAGRRPAQLRERRPADPGPAAGGRRRLPVQRQSVDQRRRPDR